MQDSNENRRFAVSQDLQWHPAPIILQTKAQPERRMEECSWFNWCGAEFSSIGPEAWRKADLRPIKWKIFLELKAFVLV